MTGRSFGVHDDASHDRLVLDVPRRIDAIADARHAVAGFLAGHGVPSVVVDDLELVTNELVTNAVVHPDGGLDDVVVRVSVAVADAVVITVANIGPVATIPPVDRWVPAPPDATSGRGLGIVRRLVDAITVVQDGDWATVTCQREPSEAGPTPRS